MKLDDYIDEVYLIRNVYLKPQIREYVGGKERYRFLPVSSVNRFVKKLITDIVGGLYVNVVNLAKDIQEDTDDEKVREAFGRLIDKLGDPHISGIRMKKYQQDL